jgi:hypothetical protein
VDYIVGKCHNRIPEFKKSRLCLDFSKSSSRNGFTSTNRIISSFGAETQATCQFYLGIPYFLNVDRNINKLEKVTKEFDQIYGISLRNVDSKQESLYQTVILPTLQYSNVW